MRAWQDQPGTLEEVEALETEVLSCANVARVLQASPTTIHDTAIQKPWLLGFPVIVVGESRVKIPKRAFLRYMRGLPKEETE
jgi:hypothetical protein